MNTVLIDVQDIAEPVWTPALETFVQDMLKVMNRDEWEVSLLLCSDAAMASINKEFRDKDGPTDVLSFPQIDDATQIPASGPFIAGDIIISLDSVRSNSVEFAVPRDEEFKRLVVHGLLHLSGFDHGSNDPSEPMLMLQERILSDYKGAARFEI